MGTKKPIETIRHGSIKAAIWENEPSSGGRFYSVTFGRSYRKEDEWKNTNSYGARDLHDLRRVITMAEQFIAEQPA